MPAPIPLCEPARILALYLLDILDTECDPEYDAVVALAAEICAMPIALISLVDADRQWFKARHNLSAPETPRALAFCAYAILQENLFIIEDTHQDTCFADHPLVVGEPYIRFYAGAPLITQEGLALGTLCVIDHVPRELEMEQAQALHVLANHVVCLLARGRCPADMELFSSANVQGQAALQASRLQVETLRRQWQGQLSAAA